MKAKHLMTMMALPVLFAACAQEELVESTAVGLQGRALLDPISINVVGESVDSRFSWNESVWGWNAFTAEDKFSAGLVDNLSGGVQDKVLTNYVFSSANEGVSYTTTSQMVEGTYFFYSYPEFEKSESSAAVAFDLTSQTKIDFNDADATVNANQLFVSPLYKLSVGHANVELPLYFVSYWSTVGLKIKNTTGEAFKVRRITLEDAVDKFVVKGTISQTKLNTANLKYTWNNDEEAYMLPANKANSDLLTLDIATAAASGTQDVITVDCQAYELANGAEATAYIQVPAGRHTDDITVSVVVETVDNLGATVLKSIEFPMVYNGDANSDSVNDCVDLKRGYTIPAYGIENGGIKAFDIDKIKLTGAEPSEGVYADSYEALEEALLGATDEVEINNLGALQLNDDAMYLLSNLRAGAKAKFLNAIEITSIGKGTVKNAIFAEGATVVGGNITIGTGAEVEAGKVLTINAGAAATIAEGTFGAGASVANNGTLTLAAVTVPTIVNGANSYMIVDANVTLADASVNAPKSLTINANKTLIASAFTIGYGKTVTNNGTIAATSAADFVINGTVDNYGTIANGSLTGLADQNSDGVDETAAINNYGVITTITGDQTNGPAKITQMSADAEVNAALGTGEIDNTENGIVISSALTVYAEYEGDQTGKLGDVMAATKVILKSGIWTNPELASGITTLDLDEVELTGDNAIVLPTVETLSLTSSEVSKDLTMADVTTAVLDGTTFNAPVAMDDLTALNLKGVNINYAFSATTATAISIQGTGVANSSTATTIAAALTTNASTLTLTIDDTAALKVTSAGSLGTVGTTAVTNNGSVENRGTIGGTGTKNGTWKGNDIKNS